MTKKNWISVSLFVWAAVATLLLLFRTQDSSTRSTACTDVHSHDTNKVLHVQVPGDDTAPSSDDHQHLPIVRQRLSEQKSQLEGYVTKVFRQYSVNENATFTMVMLTYKRTKVLPKLLLHYCQVKQLHKILVIWNDVGAQIPQDILALTNKCGVVLQFIKEKENKLTNRFKPRPEIETECVCIIDDDRLVDISDLEFGFLVWQTFRQRIIGYEERTYTHQPDGSYFYGVYPGTHPYPGYAIMGTGTAILHKAYLEMYFDAEVLPPGILDYVNSIRNCEDLSMNVMVTKFLEDISWQQPAALAVKPTGQIKNLEGEAYTAGGHRGLSMRPDHYKKRTECLNKIASFYGERLPLHYTSVRIHRA